MLQIFSKIIDLLLNNKLIHKIGVGAVVEVVDMVVFVWRERASVSFSKCKYKHEVIAYWRLYACSFAPTVAEPQLA